MAGNIKHKKIELLQYPRPAKTESNFKWHVYYVLNDEEFRNDCRDILKNAHPYNRKELLKDSSAFWRKNNKYGYVTKYGLIPKINIKKLIDKYAISKWYVTGFLSCNAEKLSPYSEDNLYTVTYTDYRGDDIDYITINVTPFVTQKELLSLWPKIVEAKKKVGYGLRKDGTRNPKLVYAIFKELNKKPKPTFRDIFNRYEERTLPGYEGKPIHGSEESLESFYNRNKPRPRPSN